MCVCVSAAALSLSVRPFTDGRSAAAARLLPMDSAYINEVRAASLFAMASAHLNEQALKIRYDRRWPGEVDPYQLESAPVITHDHSKHPAGSANNKFHAWNEHNMRAALQALAIERSQIIARAHEDQSNLIARLDALHVEANAVYAGFLHQGRLHNSRIGN
jgi:hypothetical protein